MNLIAQKIKEIRKLKGLTQEELAEQSQINLRTIQRIENSESEPRGKTLNLICDALQISIEELKPEKNSSQKNKVLTKIVNGFFLSLLNLVLMAITGFLTLDSNASPNSVFGGILLSFFIPVFIVFLTKRMNGMERMLKFGFGYFCYIVLIMLRFGFSTGFGIGIKTMLFPCLLISLGTLYFGSGLIKSNQ